MNRMDISDNLATAIAAIGVANSHARNHFTIQDALEKAHGVSTLKKLVKDLTGKEYLPLQYHQGGGWAPRDLNPTLGGDA